MERRCLSGIFSGDHFTPRGYRRGYSDRTREPQFGHRLSSTEFDIDHSELVITANAIQRSTLQTVEFSLSII